MKKIIAGLTAALIAFAGLNLNIISPKTEVKAEYIRDIAIPLDPFSFLTFKSYEDHVEVIEADKTILTDNPDNYYTIEIPSEIEGKPVTVIGDSVFKECDNLFNVALPDTIIEIGDNAFYDMGLSDELFVFPSHLERIGKDAFYSNYFRKPIVFPDTLKYIGDHAFSRCVTVPEIVLPDSIEYVGVYAFNQCSSIESVTIPDSLTYISDHMFYNCDKLKDIYIPNTITKIEDGAFRWCNSLETVKIPDSVNYIGDDAFEHCISLTTVHMPESVTKFGSGVFDETPWLENTKKINPFVTLNGVLIDGSACKGEITIPDYVHEIAPEAFYNLTVGGNECSITKVTIPETVKEIGERAFSSCKSLDKVTINGNGTIIDDYAFTGCEIMRSVSLNGTIESVGERVFSYCSSITTVNITDNIKSIDSFAFYTPNDKNYKNIAIIGSKNSYAEKYAEEKNMVFGVFADINGDEKRNIADAVLLQKWILNYPDVKIPVWQTADLVDDGVINAFDLSREKTLLLWFRDYYGMDIS